MEDAYAQNERDQSTEPCGTPKVSLVTELHASLTQTNWNLPYKYDVNQVIADPLMFFPLTDLFVY